MLYGPAVIASILKMDFPLIFFSYESIIDIELFPCLGNTNKQTKISHEETFGIEQ